MRISHIVSAIKKHKNLLYLIVCMVGVFGLSSTVFAAPATEPVLSQEDVNKVVSILNGFITGAAALMGLVTSFVTMFLYPGWVNGTLFGLQDYLREIWILISNVVYFIFAFILITIAFMNIINKGEGAWELKQAMPKFIIGVLIVPFSWFFVQFLLSLSAVLTVGVLTLPYNSFQDHELYSRALESTEFGDQKICKDVVVSFNGEFEGVDGGVDDFTDGTADDELAEHIKCKSGGKLTIRELLTGVDEEGNASAAAAGLQNSVFGIISIYSYGILKIQELDTIHGNQLSDIKTIADLIFKIVFDLLFIAVYLLLMIALLLALFVRGVRLWIFMMLSPAFGLLYFFGKGKEGVGGDNTKFSIMEFVSLALVPVYVAAALAFGMTFIMVASEGIKEQNENVDELKAGGFSLTLLGAHGDGESEKSVIGKLIVQIFGVVILWIAVMAALGASNTTKNIVQPIAKFGQDVGSLAAKAPTYAPIIPTPQGMQSAASLQTIGGQLKSAAAATQTQRAQNFMDGVNGGNTPGVGQLNAAAENAARNIERFGETGDVGSAITELRNLLRRDAGNLQNIRNSQSAHNAIRSAATAAGLTEIDGVAIADLQFRNEREITDILSAIDRAAGDRLPGSDGLFEGRFGRGGVTPDEMNQWIQSGRNPGSRDQDDGQQDSAGAGNPGNTTINITADVGNAFNKDGTFNDTVVGNLRTQVGGSTDRAAIEEAIENATGGRNLTGQQVADLITEILRNPNS